MAEVREWSVLPDGGVWVHPDPGRGFADLAARFAAAEAAGRRRHISISPSWWTRGGLVADADGPALLDADGVRHDLDLPAGFHLVDRSDVGVQTGDVFRALRLVLPGSPPTLLITFGPSTGLIHADGLGRWASAAGGSYDRGEARRLGLADADVGRARTHFDPVWQRDAAQRAWEAQHRGWRALLR